VAVSDRYEILILNEKGETISTVQRKILPDNISKKEKKYFVKDIDEIGKRRGWPKNVIRKILKKIPGKKNYFDRVLLSKQNILSSESGKIFLMKRHWFRLIFLPWRVNLRAPLK